MKFKDELSFRGQGQRGFLKKFSSRKCARVEGVLIGSQETNLWDEAIRHLTWDLAKSVGWSASL